jgi:hypothetical protein
VTWIVDYIRQTHNNLDTDDVHVCGISGFKGGGGGLFCGSHYQDGMYNQMKNAAGDNHAPKDQLQKGNFLCVNSSAQKPGHKAVVCFILWHEFGHAMAEKGVGSNNNENSAWTHELAAIIHFVPHLQWGITKDMIWGYLDMRRKNFTSQNHLAQVTALEHALGARPTAPNENYAWAARMTCINSQGDLDKTRFNQVIQQQWGNIPQIVATVRDKQL